ncbi:host cell division inhibitor Icd-like protein [Cronobacter turicensis]
MASTKNTETRPKFTWLFLGKPKREGTEGAPVTLRTAADTEKEAREAFPGWNLIFAAKIRTDCPVTCSWADQDGFLWSVIGSAIQPYNSAWSEIGE